MGVFLSTPILLLTNLSIIMIYKIFYEVKRKEELYLSYRYYSISLNHNITCGNPS